MARSARENLKDAATAVMEFMDDANGKTLNDEQKKKLKDFISLLPRKGVSNPDGEDISKDDLTAIAKKNTALDDDDVERVHIAAPVHGDDDDDDEDDDTDDTDDYRPPRAETPPHTPAVSITNSGPEAILRAIIAAMDPAGVNLSVFFAALGCFAMQGRRSITVFPEGVMFTSDGSRTFMTKRLKKYLAHFALMSKWARYRHGDNELSLAMFCTWTQNPVARKTTDNAASDDARPKLPMELHAVVVATIHHLVDGTRKVIAICDPNVIPLDNRLDSLSSITRKSHLVKLFLEYEKKFSRVPYFINIPHRERNTSSHCLTLALEWMVELIVHGLNVTRDGAGNVVAIEGFRPLRVLQAYTGWQGVSLPPHKRAEINRLFYAEPNTKALHQYLQGAAAAHGVFNLTNPSAALSFAQLILGLFNEFAILYDCVMAECEQ
ncbi:hypothetical protein B0H10DRAFT_2228170 [Mycena sp. CBHHK59/15]|nr:hypothetical protein B0H10DRAFT_2228170 [Mycena sp. CBHHK59/15]